MFVTSHTLDTSRQYTFVHTNTQRSIRCIANCVRMWLVMGWVQGAAGCLSVLHNLTLTICCWALLTMTGVLAEETGRKWQWPANVLDTGTGEWTLLTMTGHCHWYWHRRLGVTDNDRSPSLILPQETGRYWQWLVTVIDIGTGDWA